MTSAVLDEDLVLEQAVASGHDDRRRELRDRGHQLRATRRRSTLSGLKHASARSACRSHGHRAPEPTFGQVTSGHYVSGDQTDGGLSCLANGERKAIRDVKEGDQVLATDPATGKTEARTVTATMSHDDNDLRDLTIVDGDGHHGTLQTTDHHRIWSESAKAWVLARELHDGDQLREPDGTTATLVESTHRPGHEQMLDLTIDTDHTFYVDYGGDAILVHNQAACGVRLTQDRLEHIVERHWPTSDAEGAGKFADEITARTLRDDIYEAVDNGTWRPNTNGRPGQIAEYDFGHQIGVDINGNPTSRLRVVVSPNNEVVTAFPY